uniref:exodeoxyribonuclease III n=1 Tax=Latimeria chalumnae TaxID=7897 RepID=H3AY02_LATCH
KTNTTLMVMAWNTNGLNNSVKRFQLNCDIVFLQETYMDISLVSKLKARWVGWVFSSSFDSKSKGVAILISRKVSFTELEVDRYMEGRYLIIRCIIEGSELVLVNIYTPTSNPIPSYNRLQNFLLKNIGKQLIVGGDWN